MADTKHSKALGLPAKGFTPLPAQSNAASQSQERQQGLRERAAAAAKHPAGATLLAGAAAYLALRGCVAVFQRARRAFLRQLLLDLCPALDALGQPYWVDFGCLLGLHRWR